MKIEAREQYYEERRRMMRRKPTNDMVLHILLVMVATKSGYSETEQLLHLGATGNEELTSSLPQVV